MHTSQKKKKKSYTYRRIHKGTIKPTSMQIHDIQFASTQYKTTEVTLQYKTKLEGLGPLLSGCNLVTNDKAVLGT